MGDPSVIADSPPPEVGEFSAVTPAYVTETLPSTRHKLSAAERQFWDLVIETTAPRKPRPDAQLVRPHLLMSQPRMQVQVPLPQAKGQMQQFLSQTPQMVVASHRNGIPKALAKPQREMQANSYAPEQG